MSQIPLFPPLNLRTTSLLLRLKTSSNNQDDGFAQSPTLADQVAPPSRTISKETHLESLFDILVLSTPPSHFLPMSIQSLGITPPIYPCLQTMLYPKIWALLAGSFTICFCFTPLAAAKLSSSRISCVLSIVLC